MAATRVKTDTLSRAAKDAVTRARRGSVPPAGARVVVETDNDLLLRTLRNYPSDVLQQLMRDIQDILGERGERGERTAPDLASTLRDWARRNSL
jgi:hypothetical protein